MTFEDTLLRAIRLVPPGTPGKARVASRLLRSRLDRGGDAEVATPLGRFYVPSLREPVAQALLLDGVYEPDVLALLCRHVRPGGTFVDVGANVGCFTVPMAQRVGPSGRVLAVEASPEVFPYLRRNVERNGCAGVGLVQAAAAGADGGSVPFFVAPEAKFGMGTRTPLPGMAPVQVPTRSLDGLAAEHGLTRVDAIKVDVEGHEADVFRGARALLTAKPSPVVVFEFLDWAEQHATGRPGEAQEMLMDLGYTIWRLEAFPAQPCARPLREGGANLVARRL
jgi:FkbM family methyltransferase